MGAGEGEDMNGCATTGRERVPNEGSVVGK